MIIEAMGNSSAVGRLNGGDHSSITYFKQVSDVDSLQPRYEIMLDDFDGDEPLNIDPLEIEAMRVHFEMEVRKELSEQDRWPRVGKDGEPGDRMSMPNLLDFIMQRQTERALFVIYDAEVFLDQNVHGQTQANITGAFLRDVGVRLRRGAKRTQVVVLSAPTVAALAARFPDMDELKFRSSANAEDIPGFVGAGLHNSFSVKLSARDNPDGSCFVYQDPGDVATKLKVAPKTPQCAIKAVYASLWNKRAIEERSFARLDHATSAMGLAAVPAYDTESDVVANGVVITRVVNGIGISGYTLTLQQGNVLVTNPPAGTIAETTLVTFSADPSRPDRFTTVRTAVPVPYGETTRT